MFMAKYRKRMKPRKRAFFALMLSFSVIIGVIFSIGRYWVEIIDKYQEKQELEQELTLLKEKEEELQVDANKLQDPDYIGRYAREKYLYSKDDEIVIKIEK